MLKFKKGQLISVSLRSIIHSYFIEVFSNTGHKEYKHFRLLTEYHSFLCTIQGIIQDLLLTRISVSLRSIIHSYKIGVMKMYQKLTLKYFRLLTEYHSFLCLQKKRRVRIIINNFRLLTEYHSFLYEKNFIKRIKKVSKNFRLLTEYHSFLYVNRETSNIGDNNTISVSLRSIIHSYL